MFPCFPIQKKGLTGDVSLVGLYLLNLDTVALLTECWILFIFAACKTCKTPERNVNISVVWIMMQCCDCIDRYLDTSSFS